MGRGGGCGGRGGSGGGRGGSGGGRGHDYDCCFSLIYLTNFLNNFLLYALIYLHVSIVDCDFIICLFFQGTTLTQDKA